MRYHSFTQLKFLEPDMTKCLRTALQYEHETISRAPEQGAYGQQMMRKLAEISQKRNQNLGPNGVMGFNGNGGQMTPGQMNPAGAQMNQRAQQLQHMNMQGQHMPNNGMNQLGAPSMQPSMSQNAHQQPHMSGTPNPQQSSQLQPPTEQEIRETAGRMMSGLTDEKKAALRNTVMRNMNEQQRQLASANKKDPLHQFILQKARQEIMNRRASAQMGNPQQAQNMQMANAGGANMSQSASQQGNNFDFTAIMGQQANAMKLQESGNEVVPASNNPNNMFNGQMNSQNGPPGGINPAMLANGNGQGGSQMPPNMSREQMQILVMQREKQRQEQMRNNANNAARAQAMQQAQLHGQNMGAQNALNGAAGGSPAMTMLNRPIQPPGSQTPNTPQQPNRAPNMQQPNQQQPGQGSANGTNALLQHHQSMVNRNNNGVNLAILSSLPPHPVLQIPQAQQIVCSMPPPILEKLRTTPPEAFPNFIKQWATSRQRQTQNANMQMGGPQGGNQPGMNAIPNGMPDMNMQQAMLQQGQPQMQQGMDPAQLQARMQQQQLQQQQLLKQQQLQQQQQQQQNTPMQQMPANVMEQLPAPFKQQAMFSRPFPQTVLQQLGIAVPPNTRTWGQLKMHIEQHQNSMQPGMLHRLNSMMSKWFSDHPEEVQHGVRLLLMQRQQQQQQQHQQQQQQQQQQAQNAQNAGQSMNNGNTGMPNGGHVGAPTAQMMQPTPQLQQGVNAPNMGPGQGQLRMPPQTPVSAQEIAMFRQRITGAHAMSDDQVRAIIETTRRKGAMDQNNALKQAQMQNQLSQNAAGGNQQQMKPNRTPGQVVNEQAPGNQQQAGQKRAQPPSAANDDVMEIPNPNAQQPPQANKARPTGSVAGMKLSNLTPQQVANMDPVQREQLKKRYESLRQANAGANPMQGGAPPLPQAPTGLQPNDSKNQSASGNDATFKRLYTEVNHAKGPPIQQDPHAVEQITGVLRKIYKTYSQIDKIFSTALRLPEFTEDRIKQLMRAKIMVYHNWNPDTDGIKGYLSLTVDNVMYAQKIVGEFLHDMNQAKARGQLSQQFPQRVQNQHQLQQQQQQLANSKPSVGQAPTMEKSGSKHGRKASSSSKPPPAPTDNKSFDWGVGVSSPHGIPKYESGVGQLTPDKLKFPSNKRRRTGQPESAEGTPAGQTGTPSGASPGVGAIKNNSPEQLRKAQTQARVEAEERDKKRWKCTKDAACEASITGFETEDELKRHFESIHEEIENPLQFLLDSAAETLGVDLDGKPLPGKTTDKTKLGARLMPPKVGAMKRESSLTPAVKQEARTPAGQATAFATPGSGSKGVTKSAVKEGATIATPETPTDLHYTIANKIGYQPVVPANSDAAAGQLTADAQLWAEISSTVAAGVSTFEPFNFDSAGDTRVTDWGLRPEDAAGVPSSPETTPRSSSASLNSDVSANDQLRINFEWDAFGNGDVAVPEMLNAAVSGLGIDGGDSSKAAETETTNEAQEAGKAKKDDDKAVDPFEWNVDNDVSWDNIFASQDMDGMQFEMPSGGGQGDTQMEFVF